MDNKLPVFNNVDVNNHNERYETIWSVYAESCNPPLALGDYRGSYFNGHDAHVSLHNFAAAETHSV
jgi:hypothetical protein